MLVLALFLASLSIYLIWLVIFSWITDEEKYDDPWYCQRDNK